MRKRLLTILVLSASLGVGSWTARAQSTPEPVYSVDKYDPTRNATADLDQTISQARQSNKRILLEVGGNWCGWCRALEKFIHTTPSVAAALNSNYLIMKVNMSEENRNQEFLSRFPKIKGYPHIFVLEKDGALLHSQDTGPLEEAKSYSERALLDFLARWAPKK